MLDERKRQEEVERKKKYPQLKTMNEMGFMDHQLNMQVLKENNWLVEDAIQSLLERRT